MDRVRSKDGTSIAFDRSGDGPPVILVVGAFNERPTGAPLAAFLTPRFTVFNYDRRGRGASGDTLPYSVDREIEDLAALIDEAGGCAAVFGYSSGAFLALQAAGHGLPITKLALYEAPYVVEPRGHENHAANLAELIAVGRRGEAVEYFQRKMVGIPEEVVAQFRNAPFRPSLERIAHTLVYEAMILGDAQLPTALAASVLTRTLVLAGDSSAPFMPVSAQALASAMPNGQVRILHGQSHDIEPSVLGPVLEQFLGAMS